MSGLLLKIRKINMSKNKETEPIETDEQFMLKRKKRSDQRRVELDKVKRYECKANPMQAK